MWGSLIDRGKYILEPVGQYYKNLFREDKVNFYEIWYMDEAVKIFYPISLSDNPTAYIIPVLHFYSNKLKFFKYEPHFTDGFIENLKKKFQIWSRKK